jgi:hypothetical protein
MVRRSPTDPPAEPASIPGGSGEEPTDRAVLQIVLLPPDDGHAVSRRQGLRGAIARNLRFPGRVWQPRYRRTRR